MQKICVLLVNRPENPILNEIKINIKQYADKINADFIYNESPIGTYHIYHILKDYDRVICFTGNIIIREDCPNLFDIVPKDKIGLLNESYFTSTILEYGEAKRNYSDMKIKKWDGAFYNTDVLVASRKDRNLFKSPHFIDERGLPPEKHLINLRIITEKKKIHKLESKFNRIHFMDEKIGNSRLSAYVLNYTGAPLQQLYPVLIGDLQSWKNETDYTKFNKRTIVVSVTAGMGDQLCAEPIIRYMKKTEFKNDDVIVITHHPRLFNHIENIKVLSFDDYSGTDGASLVLRTCPSDDESPHKLSHIFFHPTDFASFSTLKKTIPNIDKTIKLGVSLEGISELLDIVGNPEILKNMVVIHPGKWWKSKTFPKKWWQEVINGISEAGITVGLIGKTLSDKQGFVDVECPENGYDFRDLTTLDGMISLISQGKVLLTNDSSPIHIGGAFDNWIITAATAKLDDHILPYRKGTQYYKTINLANKLLIDDLELSWLSENADSIDKIPNGKNIEDYLPDPKDVIKVVIETYNENIDDNWRIVNKTFNIYDIIKE